MVAGEFVVVLVEQGDFGSGQTEELAVGLSVGPAEVVELVVEVEGLAEELVAGEFVVVLVELGDFGSGQIEELAVAWGVQVIQVIQVIEVIAFGMTVLVE